MMQNVELGEHEQKQAEVRERDAFIQSGTNACRDASIRFGYNAAICRSNRSISWFKFGFDPNLYRAVSRAPELVQRAACKL